MPRTMAPALPRIYIYITEGRTAQPDAAIALPYRKDVRRTQPPTPNGILRADCSERRIRLAHGPAVERRNRTTQPARISQMRSRSRRRDAESYSASRCRIVEKPHVPALRYLCETDRVKLAKTPRPHVQLPQAGYRGYVCPTRPASSQLERSQRWKTPAPPRRLSLVVAHSFT